MGRPKLSFESRIEPESNSGCWLWSAGWDEDGYGLMTGNVKAHRESYRIHVGEIPAGLCVLHKCDTPACVNPAHLFLGDHMDNAIDRKMKGRSASGERSPHAKLSESDVASIRGSSESKTVLARRFGVSRGLIGHIRRGRAWRA